MSPLHEEVKGNRKQSRRNQKEGKKGRVKGGGGGGVTKKKKRKTKGGGGKDDRAKRSLGRNKATDQLIKGGERKSDEGRKKGKVNARGKEKMVWGRRGIAEEEETSGRIDQTRGGK